MRWILGVMDFLRHVTSRDSFLKAVGSLNANGKGGSGEDREAERGIMEAFKASLVHFLSTPSICIIVEGGRHKDIVEQHKSSLVFLWIREVWGMLSF